MINKASSFVLNKENLALGKPVWEDQPWKGKENRRGDKAVDGLYTKRTAAGGQCVTTDKYAQTATWRVDLGAVVSISHINIYYRTDNRPGNIYQTIYLIRSAIARLFFHSQLL